MARSLRHAARLALLLRGQARSPWLAAVALLAALTALGACTPQAVELAPASGLGGLLGPYRPEPATVDAQMSEAILRACQDRIAQVEGGDVAALRLIDARGRGQATAIYLAGRMIIECRVEIPSSAVPVAQRLEAANLPLRAQFPARLLPLPRRTIETADGTWSVETGLAGASVARIVLVLEDGPEVQASLVEGFYLASWPGETEVAERRAFDAGGVPIPDGPPPPG